MSIDLWNLIQGKAEELQLLRSFLFTLKASNITKGLGERERATISMFTIINVQ